MIDNYDYASLIPWEDKHVLLEQKLGYCRYTLLFDYAISHFSYTDDGVDNFLNFIINNKLYDKAFDEIILLWKLYND